ncbi:MAG: transcription factor jumonji jmjc protein, partial [Phenylobacterium sp.]|nr:transcription factor jumonji jmjc protein [Phenylobacterium sp.]
MDQTLAPDDAGDLDRLPRTPVAPPPSREGFEAIVRAGQPLILRGVFEDWPALAAGRRSPEALNTYLKAMDRGALAPVMEAPPSSRGRFGYGPDMYEYSFSKRQSGITETLDRIGALTGREGAPYVAIQMLPLA